MELVVRVLWPCVTGRRGCVVQASKSSSNEPMVDGGELATQAGRPIKFTPERIQQIKNLVERGKSREEIAELIGVTVGSLQVTCSRLGISLRRPTYGTGAGWLRRDEPRSDGVSTTSPSHGGTVRCCN
jgi:hypothetical protein